MFIIIRLSDIMTIITIFMIDYHIYIDYDYAHANLVDTHYVGEHTDYYI